MKCPYCNKKTEQRYKGPCPKCPKNAMRKRKNKSVKTPTIKVLSVKELEDGGALVEFEYGEDFVLLFKDRNPDKRATKKNISEFILDMLEKAALGKDGYGIQ